MESFVKVIDGEVWFTYTCEYEYEGGRWRFEIVARSFEEAEKMLAGLKLTAKVSGEVVDRIPLVPSPTEDVS